MKEVFVQIRLNKELKDKLKKKAEKDSQTLTSYLTRLIVEDLNHGKR